MERDPHASKPAIKERPGVAVSREAGNVLRLHFAQRPAPAVMRGAAPYHEAAIAAEQPPRQH